MGMFEEKLLSESNLEKIEKGKNYIIIGDEIERKTGFARGSVMSVFINNLKKIKESQPGVNIVIKNTTEDLDFYSYVLKKIPNVYFEFDEHYASKYSRYSTGDWLEFMKKHNSCY